MKASREPGYQNQVAARAEAATPLPRGAHVPERIWSDPVRAFYARADMQRRQGESLLAWAERTRVERERLGLIESATPVAPPKPVSNLRIEFGPGADD